MASKMQEIAPASLKALPARITYLKAFLDFTDHDGELIHATAPILTPLVPTVLDLVYAKLLSFDITAKAFAPPQPGQQGAVHGVKPQQLHLTHPQIQHRKNFLKGYLVKLVSNEDYSAESPFWEYLDKVGVMHTGEPGFAHRKNRPDLRVEYVHMGLLLAYVEDVLVSTVLGLDSVDLATKIAITRAVNKILWIQNDLMSRHYVVDKDTGLMPKGVMKKASSVSVAVYAQIFILGILGALAGVYLNNNRDSLQLQANELYKKYT